MKSLFILLFFIGVHTTCFGQFNFDINANGKLQYGIASKLNIEFQPSMKAANFRLSISIGGGYNINHIFFPTIHTGILLFNKGIIGGTFNDEWHRARVHFFYNALGTFRLDKKNYSYYKRYAPLFHFSDFTANPLQHPYNTSVSYGILWVHMQEKMKQRLGVFNANIAGKVQLTYYNDGGPVMKWVADKHDRYYTGGGVLSIHNNNNTFIDMIELSYHKFTGYMPHAFDIGEKLQIDYIIYADNSQFAFNHQRWKLNLSNINKGYSANVSIYDYDKWDIQDILHLNTNVPFHPDFFRSWRLSFGGRYDFNYLKLEQ